MINFQVLTFKQHRISTSGNEMTEVVTMGKRLKQCRTEKGFTLQNVADWFGINRASVSNWENDKARPDMDKLETLAKRYSKSVEYLLSGKDNKPYHKLRVVGDDESLSVDDGFLDAGFWDDGEPVSDDEIEVPFYKEVLFSAGNGSSYILEEETKKMRLNKRMLKNAGVDANHVACARNSGRSMERLISDGALIAIDKSKTQIKDERIYAFNHGGLLRVKYLFRMPNGGLRLVSENKEFPDEILGAEEVANDIEIIGWVFLWSTLSKW